MRLLAHDFLDTYRSTSDEIYKSFDNLRKTFVSRLEHDTELQKEFNKAVSVFTLASTEDNYLVCTAKKLELDREREITAAAKKASDAAAETSRHAYEAKGALERFVKAVEDIRALGLQPDMLMAPSASLMAQKAMLARITPNDS